MFRAPPPNAWCAPRAAISSYSPILKQKLDHVTAEAVVAPRNEDEIATVLAACWALDMPVTPRGGGTGNYAQAMPLAGGIVLDMTAMNRIIEIGDGTVRVEPGALMGRIAGEPARDVQSGVAHASLDTGDCDHRAMPTVEWRKRAAGKRRSRMSWPPLSPSSAVSSWPRFRVKVAPYIQHRGGPRGFLHVIGPTTLAFVDFKGNRQFISQGNLADNPNAHLFSSTTPAASGSRSGVRRVLSKTIRSCSTGSCRAITRRVPSRLLSSKFLAWDANCPQHIPVRFDAEDVESRSGGARRPDRRA